MRFPIILYLLLLSVVSVAQEPVCTWGKPLSNDAAARKLSGILGADNTGYYALREFIVGFDVYQWLEKYNKDFSLEYSKEITLNKGVMGNSTTYKDLVYLNGKFLMFAEHWDKAKSSYELNIRWINTEGDMSDDVQVLSTITAEKGMNKGAFQTAFSDDKTKLVILNELPMEKGAGEKISITVLETGTMKPLWNKDFTLAILTAKVQWNTIAVANDGSAYMYKRTQIKKDISHALYSTDKTGDKWKEYPLEFREKIVDDISLSFNSNQDFIACGLYKLEQSAASSFIVGKFYFRIDGTSKQLAVSSITPFEKDLMTDFLREKAALKDDAGINNLKLITVLQRSNGSTLMLTEVDAVSSTPVVGTSPIVYNYTHRSGSIAVLCMNADGSRAWYTPVIKMQEESGRSNENEWSSFAYCFKDDQLSILWNNAYLNGTFIPPHKWLGPDGVEHTNRKEFSDQARYPVFLVVVEPNGNNKFQAGRYGLPLFKMFEKGVFPMEMRSNIFYRDGNDLILMAEMGGEAKRYKLGKIRL